MNKLRQRVALTMCAKCRQGFNPGDRVITVFIVQKVGFNPQNKDMGAWLGEDFELAHASCPDPQLEGKLITPS